MNCSLVVITDGRYDYLSQTINSLDEHVYFAFDDLIMVNDCMDEGFRTRINRKYGNRFNIIHHPEKRGLSGAVQTAWDENTSDFIFHLEEDFIFNEPIPIVPMMNVCSHNNLAQMILKRQPAITNPAELSAGGYIEADPGAFSDQWFANYKWIKHSKFFSLNPGVYPKWVTELGWPDGGSEGDFLNVLFDTYPTVHCGIWGASDDKPKVHHIGHERSPEWVL